MPSAPRATPSNITAVPPQRVKAQAGTTNVGLALLKAMQTRKKKRSHA
jgi:hypothetical protein